MKYIKYLFLVSTIFLTGCSNSLKCNIKTEDYRASIKVIFKDNKPYKYIFKDIKEFIIYSKKLNTYYEAKKESYNSINQKYKINLGKDYVSSSIKYKFRVDEKNDIILIDKNDNLINSIEKIESFGYTCK